MARLRTRHRDGTPVGRGARRALSDRIADALGCPIPPPATDWLEMKPASSRGERAIVDHYEIMVVRPERENVPEVIVAQVKAIEVSDDPRNP